MGGVASESAAAAAQGADRIVLLLPTSAVVRRVLVEQGVLDAAPDGAYVLDMGSSQPLQTRTIAAEAERRGLRFLDAPVSGGVAGAQAGTLTIMVGGDAGDVEVCQPVLDALGRRTVHVGPVGAGHAVKALNNLLSATHLLASCEVVSIARRFELDPHTVLEAVNASSGRSASTERKIPDFVLSASYASGFTAELMLKDMRTAVDLAHELGAPSPLGIEAVELWDDAVKKLPPGADHTQIARWLETS
jgi:3-hydroxyisobutyrate dehydrogenase